MPSIKEEEIRAGDPKRQTTQSEPPAFGKKPEAGNSPLAKQGEMRIPFQPSTKETVGGIRRDVQRWPETGGYPPIMGGSGREARDEKEQDDPWLALSPTIQRRINKLIEDGVLPANMWKHTKEQREIVYQLSRDAFLEFLVRYGPRDFPQPATVLEILKMRHGSRGQPPAATDAETADTG